MRAIHALAAAVLAVGVVAPASGAAASAPAAGPADAAAAVVQNDDFNGDGIRDAVFGDPGAWVAGQRGAGVVHVFYGGRDGGIQTLSQLSTGVGGAPEVGDGFGGIIRQADVDRDGNADLVLGLPGEDIGSAANSGMVQVVFGSPSGLGLGRPSLDVYQGKYSLGGVPEAGDRFGAAIATSPLGGTLAIGVPGEDFGVLPNTGMVHQISIDTSGYPDSVVNLSQNSPDVWGVAENGDEFGAWVGLGGTGLFVGAPGEAIGARRAAGVVHYFRSLSPIRGRVFTQDSPTVSGGTEAGDRFGAAGAVSSVRTGTTTEDVFGIGVPGEDLSGHPDAGMAHLFRLTVNSSSLVTYTQVWSVNQDSSGVNQVAETGDGFGSVVRFLDQGAPEVPRMLVVGVPSEDVGAIRDAGVVQRFTTGSPTPGTGDVLYLQGEAGLVGVPQAGDRFGSALGQGVYDGQYWLFIGVPDDVTIPSGMVQAVSPLPGVTPLAMYAGKDGFSFYGQRFGAGMP